MWQPEVRKLQLGKKFGDLRLRPVDGADEFTAHDTIAVDDIGLGKLEGPVKIIALLFFIADGEQTYVVIVEKSTICPSVCVDTDSQHSHTTIFEPLLKLH